MRMTAAPAWSDGASLPEGEARPGEHRVVGGSPTGGAAASLRWDGTVSFRSAKELK